MLPPLHRVLHFVRCLTVATIEKKQPIVRSFVFFEPNPNILQLCLGGGGRSHGSVGCSAIKSPE